MPALFKRLVETFALRPARVSKYRTAMAALGRTGDPAATTTPHPYA